MRSFITFSLHISNSSPQALISSSIIICFCLPGTSSALVAQFVLWHQTLLLFYFMVFFARNTDQVITKLVHYNSSGETGDSVLSLLVGVRLEWVITSSGWNIRRWASFKLLKNHISNMGQSKVGYRDSWSETGCPRNSRGFFILKFTEPRQNCCCPVQKICPERLNWPGRLKVSLFQNVSSFFFIWTLFRV